MRLLCIALVVGACNADTRAPQSADTTQLQTTPLSAQIASEWKPVHHKELGVTFDFPYKQLDALTLEKNCSSNGDVLAGHDIHRDAEGRYFLGGPSGSRLQSTTGVSWLMLHGYRHDRAASPSRGDVPGEPYMIAFIAASDTCWITVDLDEKNPHVNPEMLARMLRSVEFTNELPR